MPLWRNDDIADRAIEAVAALDRDRRAEQAVAGPARAPGSRRVRRDTERDRCDIVLAQAENAHLIDAVRDARDAARAEGGLFEPRAEEMIRSARTARTNRDAPSDEAFWLELKTTASYRYREGVPQPNPTYAGELVSGLAKDAAKLAAAAQTGAIAHAAALAIVFGPDEAVLRHDAVAAAHKLLDRDLPIESPAIRTRPIEDRVGNAAAMVLLVPVRQALPPS